MVADRVGRAFGEGQRSRAFARQTSSDQPQPSSQGVPPSHAFRPRARNGLPSNLVVAAYPSPRFLPTLSDPTSRTIPAQTTRATRVALVLSSESVWLRGLDLNQRPLGYEPNELPGCATPR